MAASPDAEACRKAPGGGATGTPASDVVGGRKTAIGSGSSSPSAQAMRGRACVRANSVSAQAVSKLQGCVGAQQHVGAAVEQVGDHRGLAAQTLAARQQVAQRRQQRHQRGMQHEALVRSTTSALRCRCRPSAMPCRGTPRGKVHAATLARCGAGRQRQRHIGEPGAAQRGRQHVTFFRDIRGIRQVLQRAAAAGAEMRAGWRYVCLARIREGSAAAAECRQPGLRAAEDQRVHVVRALIRVDRFQVHHVADHVVLVGHAVAAVHVARHRGRSPAPCRSCCASAG